jgi:hypothetical protein
MPPPYEVTERDFRMPEFRDAKVEDYEFRRGDGKLVRKDRWERGIRSIAYELFGDTGRDFEIEEVVDGFKALMNLIPDRELPPEPYEG